MQLSPYGRAFLWIAFVATAGWHAVGQQPFALLHSRFDPGTNAHPAVGQGYSVAIDGHLAVVGSLYSDLVKVYDADTAELLHTLPNPAGPIGDKFGVVVAVAQERVAVSAIFNNTGGSLAGLVYVYDLAVATPTAPILTLTNPSPATSQSFGTALSLSGTRVAVGSVTDDAGAADSGRVYIYDTAGVAPTVPWLVLDNPSPAQSDFFGAPLAFDGPRLLVGAPGDNTGTVDAGSAYLFDLASQTPGAPLFTITNPFPIVRGSFGSSLALSGTRAVIGVDWNDGITPNPGRACVYDLAGATPTRPDLVLTNPAPEPNARFASALACSGRWLVVGSYRNEGATIDRGNAFVYDLAGSIPGVPVVTLTNPAPAGNDQFAFSVALSGPRALIGAFEDDAGAARTGSAYVFDVASPVPTTPVATLHDPIPARNDRFGHAIAISGPTVVVGAPWDDTGAEDAGVAYIYCSSATGAVPASPSLVLTNPNPKTGDFFGGAVSISGSRVVVGVPLDDDGTNNAGIAYVYDLDGPTPAAPILVLPNPQPYSNENFGQAVAVAWPYVVVGAPNDLGRAFGLFPPGAAYVYDLAGSTPGQPMLTLTNPSPTGTDRFGYAVALAGNRVVVGAFNQNQITQGSGAAYVYDLTSSSPARPVVALTNPAPTVSARFGISVGISGSRVVVGASKAEGGLESGSVHVFDLTQPAPFVPALTLANPSPAAGDRFGHSVAISGSRVVVGAIGDGTGAPQAGRAYLYDLAGPNAVQAIATLANPTPGTNDWFGYTVAIEETTIVAGTPADDTKAEDRGAAYWFGMAPALSIAPAGAGLVTLSWTPATSSGFRLQFADSLTSPHWTNAPSGTANPATIAIPATKPARFYRLSQP